MVWGDEKENTKKSPPMRSKEFGKIQMLSTEISATARLSYPFRGTLKNKISNIRLGGTVYCQLYTSLCFKGSGLHQLTNLPVDRV
jgi:hypothetical protein